MEKIKVCFRIEKDGEPVAVFPYLTYSPGFVTFYAHVGQHGAAAWDYVRFCTRPATVDEYVGLLDELTRIGYDNLEIMQRFPSLKRITKNTL